MVRNSATFQCFLYKKIKNKNEWESEGKMFFARVSTDEENEYLQTISGFLTATSNRVLSIQDINCNVDKGDKVEFLGDIYIVENMTANLSMTRHLGQSRMSNDYVKRNCQKFISLR